MSELPSVLNPPSGSTQERSTAIRASWARAEDWRDHKESHRDKAGNGQHQHTNEHCALIFVPGWPKVDQDDAHAVKRVVEHCANERQRDETHDASAEDQQRIVVDLGSEADERDIYDVDEQEEQNTQTG